MVDKINEKINDDMHIHGNINIANGSYDTWK